MIRIKTKNTVWFGLSPFNFICKAGDLEDIALNTLVNLEEACEDDIIYLFYKACHDCLCYLACQSFVKKTLLYIVTFV